MTVHKNNEIISNFYLIRENGQPTYVGYTNRSIKQRFTEHLHDKDFTGDATVEELDSLSFPFTWDINTINQYAQEVSDRETELIAEYGTGDSIWQKGTSGRVGGQAWADVKHFVMANRDNPKFWDMEESEILAYLDKDRVIKFYMSNFVHHIDDPVKVYMHSFVSNMDEPIKIYMSNFVTAINDPIKYYMKNFVHNIDDPVKLYMKHFVSHINDPVKIYMGHFVTTIDDPVKVYMGNFVRHMQNK